MMFKYTGFLLLLPALAVPAILGQSIRDRTRPDYDTGTRVTESQAVDLTLTLSDASVRPIQVWIRTAAAINGERKILTAELGFPEAEFVKIGQRVRAFPPEARSSIYQAKISRISFKGDRAVVDATLPGLGRENASIYVMEIVVERGQFLSVPNEAIIEEGAKHIVYIQQHPGHYVPREIHTGIQGELYTQVLQGVAEGDQVVTFGSFFIDSEYKLKLSGQPAMSNDHTHH